MEGQTSDKSQWEDVVPEDTLTVYWDGGFSEGLSGDMTITLFNESAGGAKLCDFTFKIIDGTPGGTTGGTSNVTGKTYTDPNGATIRVGDTWLIDGLFSITINSITEANVDTSSEPDIAAVYVIDYTYTNIGLKDDDLYFSFTMDTTDAAGKEVDYYYLSESVSPDFIKAGETMNCKQAVSVSKKGALTSNQWAYNDLDRYDADFILEP